jgi:hypothetical protein
MAGPIDRTWFNTLIDDDGSGTVGTIWNKAQVDGLLDSVDASLAGVVDKNGTPASGHVAVFGDGDTVTGSSSLTFDTSGGSAGLELAGSYNFLQWRDLAWPVDQQIMRAVWYGGNLQFIGVDNAGGGVGASPLILNTAGDAAVGRDLSVARAIYPNGGVIAFPATQIPSASPYGFDDYREGPWTPVWTGTSGSSGTTYAFQEGFFVKIGRKVTCWGRLAIGSVGTIAGSVQLYGLPVPASSQSEVGDLRITNLWALNGSVSNIWGKVVANTAAVDLLYFAAPAAAASPLAGSAMQNGTDMSFVIEYLAAQ